MPEDFNLGSRQYWHRMAWGLLTGLLSAMGSFLFIGLMDFGQELIWPDRTDWTPFSGSWWFVGIMAAAGFIVGVIHHFTAADQLDVFDAMDEGYLDPKPVPASLLASLVSLIGGFSLGPEVPSGMLAAGLGSWISKRRGMDADATRINVLSGVSAAYAGLFSAPFAMLVILLESPHVQSVVYYGTILIAGLSAVIGFALFYGLGGETYSSLLGLLSPPAYHLEIWHLGAAVLLGLVAVPIGLLFPILMKVLGRVAAPLKGQPILRSTLGGLLLGLLGVALPITIGIGTTEMAFVTEHAAQIGVGLLLTFAVAKIVALAGALSFGFIGGPIFPMLFVGSAIGSAVLLLFPQLPAGLALGCMIVAVPAAVVPIPIALGVIGIVVIGLSPTNTVPVFIAGLIAFSVVRGLILPRLSPAGSSGKRESADMSG